MDQGTQIAYVPTHAEGELKHKDVQFGFVMSKASTEQEAYFCRYWNKDLKTLRTKANSELTPVYLIVEYVSVPAIQVRRAILLIEMGF